MITHYKHVVNCRLPCLSNVSRCVSKTTVSSNSGNKFFQTVQLVNKQVKVCFTGQWLWLCDNSIPGSPLDCLCPKWWQSRWHLGYLFGPGAPWSVQWSCTGRFLSGQRSDLHLFCPTHHCVAGHQPCFQLAPRNTAKCYTYFRVVYFRVSRVSSRIRSENSGMIKPRSDSQFRFF